MIHSVSNVKISKTSGCLPLVGLTSDAPDASQKKMLS